MDLSHMWINELLAPKVTRIFCLLWPFVSIAFLRDRGRSFAPLTAMLVPLTVSACGMWLFLIEVMRGMALSGAERAFAAGFADAYELLFWGGFSALAVSAFALKKKHVPSADFGATAIAALLMINVVLALMVTPTRLVLLGAAFAIVLALGAFAWLWVVHRERVQLRAIPYGVTILVIAAVILGFVVQSRIDALRRVAMGG